MLNNLEFGNLQTAWQGINEYLFLECEEVAKRGGGLYGPEWISYNNYVIIKRAWVDPEFDLGSTLGYTIKKWTSLVKNYIDFNYLDLLKSELNLRTNKLARSYNYSFHFNNLHGSGKDCLISLLFSKRLYTPHPYVVFTVRTSEVTKRLIWDFILVQRVVEYVYGHNDVEIHFFAPSFYITAEAFIMYNNVRPIHKLLDKHKKKHNKEYKKENHNFQNRVIRIFDEYYNHPDPWKVTYKVHRRSILQIQKGEDGKPKSKVKPLLVKNLKLKPDAINYPENIISKSQRRKHDNIRKTINSDSKD